MAKKYIMSEDRIQQECYRSFNNKYPHLRGCLFHCPNGGSRDGREAVKFKTMGVFPGVSDFIFLYDGKCYLIELKNEIGSQSDVQKSWEALMRSQGFQYFIVRSEPEFMELINQLIIKKNE